MEDLEYLVDVPVTHRQLNDLFASSWVGHEWRDFEPVLGRSLGYICACRGDELIGFVNLAWDGGIHAFVLDTTVHPNVRRRGVGRRLVKLAVEEARERRVEWVHVDFVPHLREFYEFYYGCGFRRTEALAAQDHYVRVGVVQVVAKRGKEEVFPTHPLLTAQRTPPPLWG
jgi:GNAT superfamily N-acetyltransferase